MRQDKDLVSAHMDAIPILIDFVKEMSRSQDPAVAKGAHKTLSLWDNARTPKVKSDGR